MAIGHHGAQPVSRTAGKLHRRLAAGQVDNAHVFPEHAVRHAGAQRFRAGFLCGKALGVGCCALMAAIRFALLNVGKEPLRETVTITFERFFDPADVNQIAAEIGLVDQKRAGLNITLNQLKPADDPTNLTGSRLAGEVQELEARRANLVEQKQLLDREQERLQLRSPIDGTVIAWEVEKYLENRPVRRGDTLLRVAALDHRWRLESAVADWESGYVVEAYRALQAENKPLSVEYVLASSPGVRRSGKVLNISSTMLEVDGGQHLEVLVEPDALLESRRLGTSVTVSIPCGQFPRWFVWTRSILDAVHRRFWF